MIAYSARWGDAVREPPYNINDWRAAITFVVNNWFPARPAILLAQLRADSLWPAIAAPAFSQFGGDVPEGYALEMLHTNTAGAIFFTLDGSDPRAVGGGVAVSAQSYSGAIIVNAPTTVRARVLTGSNWSPILEYTFFPPQDLSKLLVTEIMYHPPSIGAVDSDEFEFIELKNTGTGHAQPQRSALHRHQLRFHERHQACPRAVLRSRAQRRAIRREISRRSRQRHLQRASR